jgi:polyphenol oxidase
MPGVSIDSRAMANTVHAAAAARPAAGLDLLGWPAFQGLPVEAFVTGRGGGVSVGAYKSLNMSLSVGDDPEAVLENRRRVAGALGAELADMVFCNQTHSDHPYVVSAVDRGRGTQSTDDAIPATDAVVTTEPGVVLVILAADCVPIVLYDPVAHVLGCVHSGWRGTVARVSEAAVAAMGALGASPENVIAGVGPAVGVERYQVGAEVAAAVDGEFGAGAGAVIGPDGTGRWLLDLPAANRLVLREAGLPDANVHVTPYVTGDGRFFSDRAVRPCGRLALVAWLRTRGE